MKEIVLAGGCFWGLQAYLDLYKGMETEVGYANGDFENPTYRDVCTNATGHAEVVYVKYDESIIDLKDILIKYFKVIDPTLLNRQGPDIGSQYRTGIFYVDSSDKPLITEMLALLANDYEKPIVVENMPLTSYFKAEEYHQKYLEKNPNGYCHIDLKKFR